MFFAVYAKICAQRFACGKNTVGSKIVQSKDVLSMVSFLNPLQDTPLGMDILKSAIRAGNLQVLIELTGGCEDFIVDYDLFSLKMQTELLKCACKARHLQILEFLAWSFEPRTISHQLGLVILSNDIELARVMCPIATTSVRHLKYAMRGTIKEEMLSLLLADDNLRVDDVMAFLKTLIEKDRFEAVAAVLRKTSLIERDNLIAFAQRHKAEKVLHYLSLPEEEEVKNQSVETRVIEGPKKLKEEEEERISDSDVIARENDEAWSSLCMTRIREAIPSFPREICALITAFAKPPPREVFRIIQTILKSCTLELFSLKCPPCFDAYRKHPNCLTVQRIRALALAFIEKKACGTNVALERALRSILQVK